jgi:cobalt-zinc-cadmium efflux system outer membrane protein
MPRLSALPPIPLLWPLCSAAALLLTLTITAAASELAEHHDADLDYSSQLSLSAVLEATLRQHPQAGLQAAHAAKVEAETEFGARWFPDSTQLSGFHLSDQAFDDIGAYENEISFSFPLWLPGEKKAQSGLGYALETASVSRAGAFRWRASGDVRQQLWELQAARRRWQLAKEQESRLGELLGNFTGSAEAGEIARADLLAVVQELASWKAETLTLEAGYRDAVRNYRASTGLNSAPLDMLEALSGRADLEESHPALQFAIDTVREASAQVDLAAQRASARPTVDLFWRGYRGDRSSPEVDSLGLGFSLPLGKPPRRGVEVAQARENLATAESELLATRRALELQLHEARHLLHTTRQQLELSTTGLDAAAERLRMDQLSFELGEISTIEWLRRLSDFKRAEQSHDLLTIQEGAAIAAYNQAVGDSL